MPIDGLPSYNVLFPKPAMNSGQAFLEAGSEIQLPERGGFSFDAEQGTEKLWFIWARGSCLSVGSCQGAGEPARSGASFAIANGKQKSSSSLRSTTPKSRWWSGSKRRGKLWSRPAATSWCILSSWNISEDRGVYNGTKQQVTRSEYGLIRGDNMKATCAWFNRQLFGGRVLTKTTFGTRRFAFRRRRRGKPRGASTADPSALGYRVCFRKPDGQETSQDNNRGKTAKAAVQNENREAPTSEANGFVCRDHHLAASPFANG